MQFLAAISTHGHMSFQDIKNECGKEAWVPLVVMRFEVDGKERTVLPLFSNEDVCRKWSKRNLPKDWGLCGGAYITQEDLENCEAKGWTFEMLRFPRKFKDIVEFDVEPIEIGSNPEVHAR